jgi:AhpD family alkylhydroperoxidase
MAAPTAELRRRFGNDPARWDAFRQQCAQELRRNGALLGELRSLARHGRVTLVFSARDEAHSDAVVPQEAVLQGDSGGFQLNRGATMSDMIYPPASRELAAKRRELAPEIQTAFDAFSQRVFADGALPAKTKQIIAVAVAHVTQCPYCIQGHTKAAMRHGATEQELMEAIWVAAEMRAGGAYAHSAISLTTMAEHKPQGG